MHEALIKSASCNCGVLSSSAISNCLSKQGLHWDCVDENSRLSGSGQLSLLRYYSLECIQALLWRFWKEAFQYWSEKEKPSTMWKAFVIPTGLISNHFYDDLKLLAMLNDKLILLEHQEISYFERIHKPNVRQHTARRPRGRRLWLLFKLILLETDLFLFYIYHKYRLHAVCSISFIHYSSNHWKRRTINQSIKIPCIELFYWVPKKLKWNYYYKDQSSPSSYQRGVTFWLLIIYYPFYQFLHNRSKFPH